MEDYSRVEAGAAANALIHVIYDRHGGNNTCSYIPNKLILFVVEY